MNDYERMVSVIRFLDELNSEHPDLDLLASHVGLSTAHLHRFIFSWAGMAPEEFLESLTLSYARKILQESNRIFDPGAGELYDPRIHLEIASPEEGKVDGEGWVIKGGYAETPFGRSLIAECPRGLCHLVFLESGEDAVAWNQLQACWPKAQIERDDKRAGALCEGVFSLEGQRPRRPRMQSVESAGTLNVYLKGTAFQIQTWQALLQIPAGSLISYGGLAALSGNPKASQAVGTAIGNNPIAFVIPCHRVIRETGAIGGYRWGVPRKKAMWVWERTLQRKGC
jgi:AraC family transcriptional regulator of adaptative response/methylated-DNA-[protein]-cysteine methyltransferase